MKTAIIRQPASRRYYHPASLPLRRHQWQSRPLDVARVCALRATSWIYSQGRAVQTGQAVRTGAEHMYPIVRALSMPAAALAADTSCADAQDLIATAAASLHEHNYPDNPDAWRMATRAVHRDIYAARRNNAADIDDHADAIPVYWIDASISRADNLRIIDTLRNKLRDPLRDVLDLWAMDMDNDEIAAHLHISVDLVRKRKQRIRETAAQLYRR